MKLEAPVRAYIGLGGNEGNVRATLTQAMQAIDALPETRVGQRSTFYRTPAWGRTDQPDFLNAAIEVQTRLDAPALLAALLAIERQFGRERHDGQRWGPRVLDLDLLVYGEDILSQPGLTVPHPHLHERAFVLVPLAQIAPDLIVPGQGRVADLLAAVDGTGIEALP